jgi:hypothetical protein
MNNYSSKEKAGARSLVLTGGTPVKSPFWRPKANHTTPDIKAQAKKTANSGTPGKSVKTSTDSSLSAGRARDTRLSSPNFTQQAVPGHEQNGIYEVAGRMKPSYFSQSETHQEQQRHHQGSHTFEHEASCRPAQPASLAVRRTLGTFSNGNYSSHAQRSAPLMAFRPDVDTENISVTDNSFISNPSRIEDAFSTPRGSLGAADVAILENLRVQEKAALLSDIQARDRSLKELQSMLNAQEDQRRERQLLDIARGKFLAASLVIQVRRGCFTLRVVQVVRTYWMHTKEICFLRHVLSVIHGVHGHRGMLVFVCSVDGCV